MRKKITILSFALARQCVTSYEVIIDNIKKQGYIVNHIGMSEDGVINPIRKQALEAYKKITNNVISIQKNSVQDLTVLIDDVFNKFHPDIFLTDNERLTSINIIRGLQKKGVPSILIEHGYLSSPPRAYSNCIFRFFKQRLDKMKFKWNTNALMFFPPGNKGDYKICTLGKLNKINYQKYGVNTKRIFMTGFPYFDKVVVQKTPLRKKKQKSPSKVLIISSALGLLSKHKEETIKFINMVFDIAKDFNKKLDITLRLKPGEDIASYVPFNAKDKLKDMKIKIDNTEDMSYSSVASYDIVMGDASIVLFEAIILNKPVIIFQYADIKHMNEYIDNIWRDKLQALIIHKVSELKRIMSRAMSDEYLKNLQKNLKTNEEDLFFRLDGKAGYRVAKIIFNTLSGAYTK